MKEEAIRNSALEYYRLATMGDPDRQAFEDAFYMIQLHGCSKNTSSDDLYDLVQRAKKMHDESSGCTLLLAECVEAVGTVLEYGCLFKDLAITPSESRDFLLHCENGVFNALIMATAIQNAKCNIGRYMRGNQKEGDDHSC